MVCNLLPQVLSRQCNFGIPSVVSCSCMNAANPWGRSAMGSLSLLLQRICHLSTGGVVMWSRKVGLQLEFSLLKSKMQLGLSSLVCAAACVPGCLFSSASASLAAAYLNSCLQNGK